MLMDNDYDDDHGGNNGNGFYDNLQSQMSKSENHDNSSDQKQHSFLIRGPDYSRGRLDQQRGRMFYFSCSGLDSLQLQ